MIIRQAMSSDAVAIRRLLIQLGYPPSHDAFVNRKIERYSKEDYHLLVCDIDQEPVGFISLHWFEIFHSEGKMGRITAFCVSEHLRKQGIGSKLLVAAEKFLVLKGCSKIEVTSNVKRVLAHAFYLKHGYSEDSRRFVKALATVIQ